MLNHLYKIIDRLAAAGLWLAATSSLALIGCTIFEVVMRYGLNQPSIWAFDVAYMLNGAVFILGAASALKTGAHVRIDFLASLLPKRFTSFIDGIFFIGPASIAVGAMAYAAISRLLRAIRTGEVEAISPWAPVMWPFYTVMSVGLCMLTLSCVAQGLRSLNLALLNTPPQNNLKAQK